MQLFDTLSLKYFRSVCEEKNIAHAADKEATVPSAISKRISAMEKAIGTQLLQRGSRGVEPTSAGNVLLKYACQILDLMEEMHSELSNFPGELHGMVRVYGPISSLISSVSNDIGDFLRQYSNVQVTITEKITSEIIHAVENGNADIGICWSLADLKRMEQFPYRYDELGFLVKRSHPLARRDKVTFNDILDYDMIDIFPGSIVPHLLIKEAAASGKHYKCRVCVTSIENACRAVSSSLGVAVIPKNLVPIPRDLVLVPIAGDWARRNFVIIVKSFEKLSLPARLLVENLVASAKAELLIEASRGDDSELIKYMIE